MKIKRFFVTVIVCAVVLVAAALLTGYWKDSPNNGILKVGFVYSEDESTPYTANFVMAQRALQAEYGSKIEVMFKSNILARESEQPMRDLIRSGCRILFINMDTDIPITLAREYPGGNLPGALRQRRCGRNEASAAAGQRSRAGTGCLCRLCGSKFHSRGYFRLHGIYPGGPQRGTGSDHAGSVYRKLE